MVDKGEIIDQCVWGRYGANNILLSTATEEYKAAVKNTEVASKSALWADVKLGDTVVLQNNIRGIWLGRMHPLLNGSDYGNEKTVIGNDAIGGEQKMVHVIHVVENVKKSYKNKTEELHLIASPKLSSIEPTDTPLTQAQAEVLANNLLNSSHVDITTAGYKTFLMLSFGKAKIKLNKIDVVINNIDELTTLCDYVFVDVANNRFGNVSSSRYNSCYASLFDGASLAKNELRALYSQTSDYYHRNSWSQQSLKFTFQPGKYFHIEIDAVTAAGNNFKVNIR